jgi:hypothetical protein
MRIRKAGEQDFGVRDLERKLGAVRQREGARNRQVASSGAILITSDNICHVKS